MRFGFANSANYTSQNPLMDAEQLLNWYVEQAESPGARTQYSLNPCPGLNPFANLGKSITGGLPSVRGGHLVNGRVFFVAGTHLFECFANGTYTDYGAAGGDNNIVDDGLPATMVDGGTVGGSYPSQLLIASGGTLTVFSLVSNTFQALTTPPSDVLMIDYLDGFFVALTSANDYFVSNPEDATTWPGLSVSQVSVYSDALLALIASNRLLWVFGAKRAVAYYNAGNPVFPFSVVNGGFMEVGIVAQFSVARIALASGTTICWLGGDERGAGVCFAANGFTPQRISDHAFEYWMSQQESISDAIGLAMQDQGHNFYVLRFPTANATWVYDMDLGFWHRRTSLINGTQQAHRMRCHVYAFGQHLIGDYASGNVYSMSVNYYSEMLTGMTVPIIRTRVSPTVSKESTWLFMDEFQVDFETGNGPQPPLVDGFGKPRPPYAMISVSKDFGKTWGMEFQVPCGQAGEFKTRAVIRRLGRARQWTFKVTVSDPIPWRIADAYLNPTEQSYERLAKTYAKFQ